jgi:23S rRNA (guanosine2251-2'-O)-methyltransferase
MQEKSVKSESKKRQPAARHSDPYGKRHGISESLDHLDDTSIEGRNSVLEALRTGVSIDKVFIAKGELDATLKHIVSLAREKGAVVSETDRRKLDAMSMTSSHQGVIAKASISEYVNVSDILEIAKQKNENPLLILCDEITDPHNLGAIIRTAEAIGVHGVVITKHRSAGLSAIVAKTSGGAVYHTAIARVANLNSAIAELKKSGVWLYGTSPDGETSLWQSDLTGSAALVVGSEGKGISRLVRENCDYIIQIPMLGRMASLNASVSAAVILYEAVRQRKL